MGRPFEGFKVLDMTHVLAGPYCGYQLALLGADVMKIEPPDWPDPVRARGPVPSMNDARMGMNYLAQNGNKRAITLNLKSEAGKRILKQLVKDADVVIENYRAGAFPALGLGYDEIKAINPKIVYCSITAFGQAGPWATRTAYDPVIQSMAGIVMKTTAGADHPVMPGAPFIDYATGLNAAFAIASALLHRERSGKGQYIDCAMLDTALTMIGPALVADNYAGPKKPTPREAGLDCYLTKNGYLQLGAYNIKQNNRLWGFLEHPEFCNLESWQDLWDNASKMRSALQEVMLTRTAEEWEEALAAVRVPSSRVRTLEEASMLPQLAERGFLQEIAAEDIPAGVRVPGAGFIFREDGPRLTSPPPRFGQHTETVLKELNYGAESIAQLRRDGVI
ncbi:CaiB/BaiF CoA transferase family protein [Pollutimonas nitritireducens]|nr:CaiB/BaiF CoA-transferase family protein [Pollutimonas nitritireducens]